MNRYVITMAVALLCGCGLRAPTPDGSGTIECTQVQVAPQVAGRIAELLPQEGDAVEAGAVVARLDATDYELRMQEATAAMLQAKAQLDLVLAGPRTEDIEFARQQVNEAEASARAAATDLQRLKQALDAGSVTPKQADDARANAERTGAVLAARQRSLEKLEKGSREQEIAVARAQLQLAEARLAQAVKAVADCTVLAPMDGVVTTRSRERGEIVSPGATLLTLSRLDEVWVSVYLPETHLPRVKLGQKAKVRVDGDAKTYEGTVTFISSEAEFTPKNVQTPEERAKLVYRVKITLQNKDGVFKPGMPADAYLVAAP